MRKFGLPRALAGNYLLEWSVGLVSYDSQLFHS